MQRFFSTNSYHHNDSSFQYVDSIIKNYKKAATYQFMGLLFKNQLINNEKIEIPAVEGDMGGLKYYMFSIEPGILLKMGFVLHRTKANEEEMPTYQRLLVPSRLKGITTFIDGPDGNGGGFFPNSIIVNFNTKKHKIIFEAGSKSGTCQGNDVCDGKGIRDYMVTEEALFEIVQHDNGQQGCWTYDAGHARAYSYQLEVICCK